MRPLFTIQHPADQPISPRVLIHYFEGAMDAGNAGALAVDQLLMTLPSERVATFDIDALVDYRARRPTMTFVHNNYSSVTTTARTSSCSTAASRTTAGTSSSEPWPTWPSPWA